MKLPAPRVLMLSVVWLSLIAAQQGHAESNDNLTSPVTTLEEFTKARDLGDQAKSFEDKARYWRHALSWHTNHIEWLRLAHRFAHSLQNEWDKTGTQKEPPQVAHPYYCESESVYREILARCNHMDLYDRNGGAQNYEDSSLLVPAAANYLGDYPRVLSMMQDFHDRRVREWMAEPVPIKQPESGFLIDPRYKRVTHEQSVANWLERRTRAGEGRVFCRVEMELIDGAVRNYVYRCREHNSDYNPVPDLAELAARYTAPAISAAIRKYVEDESPPFPRVPVPVGKVVELTIHNSHIIGSSKLDFDTGNVVANPIQWSSGVQQSAWMTRGGVDIEVDYYWNDLMWIIAFGFELIEVPAASWDENSASWDQLKASEVKKGVLKTGSRGGDQKQYRILANANFPATFAFQTREGGMGLLQITGMKEPEKHSREYSIRYRLNKPGKLDP